MSESHPRRGCLWPMWPDHATPTHEYCNHPRIEGSSYCAEHYARSIRANESEDQHRFVPRRAA